MLGYRYILDKVCYPAQISPNKTFSVTFVVRNVGSAPFYYRWPVEISLLDPKAKIPVWRDTFQDVDIRQWLPGDKWNSTTKSYDLKPIDYQTDGTFQLPQTVKTGEYIVALAILDPAGMVPSVRFATENYFEGGRHPIGLVGVGKTVLDPVLNPVSFSDPADDRTLKYVHDAEQGTLPKSFDPQLSLQEATAIGDIELVRSLLDKGIGVDSRDDSIEKTALQYAAISGHRDIVDLLLAKGAETDAGAFQMGTPLQYACREGHEEIVELLIAHGADVNTRNDNGETSLDIALKNDRRDITDVLVAHGAEIATIYIAVQIGDLDRVKAFLQQDTAINATDDKGHTALHMAAMSESREIAEYLIEKGADVEAKNNNGYTPFYEAIWNSDANMVGLLVTNGVDVNYTPERDYPPLHYAVWWWNLDIASTLVDHGADCDVKDQDGWTAFRYAVNSANTKMVDLFVAKGADVSGIHRAAGVGDLARVKSLLEQGTDVDVKDDMGWTPLYWAASMGQEEVAEFLLIPQRDLVMAHPVCRT